MKKLVTIFALFTMVMLTSFVEPSDIGGREIKNMITHSSPDIGGREIKNMIFQTSSDIGGREIKNM